MQLSFWNRLSVAGRFVAVMIVVLVGLVIVGLIARGPLLASGRTMQSGARYASLPNMTLALGGADGRSVDVKVQLELGPGVDKLVIGDIEQARIADRIGDRMRDVEPSALSGTDGAVLVKNVVRGAVNQELGNGKVKAVLLERLTIR